MTARAATVMIEGDSLVLRLAPPSGAIVFSPERARELAATLLVAAEQADMTPGTPRVGEWDELWPAFIRAEREQNEPEARRLRDELVLWHHVHEFPVPSWLSAPTTENADG